MKAADIDRQIKDGPRRKEAHRIYSETLVPLLAGDGPNAGGVYDQEGFYQRRDKAHDKASAAVDRFLNGSANPSASKPAVGTTARQADEAVRNAALVESLGGIDKLLGKAAQPVTSVPAIEPDAFSWDDILPAKGTELPAQPQAEADVFDWDEAFGRPKETKLRSAAATASEPDPCGWDEVLDQHNRERKHHGF